jgi:hypothetical protein
MMRSLGKTRFMLYTIPLVASAMFLYLSRAFKVHSTLSGWLSNVSASFIMIPLVALTFDWLKGQIDKSLKGELFDYIKKDVDSDMISCLLRINRLFRGEASSLQTIEQLLSFTEIALEALLTDRAFLGFHIYKNWNESRNLFESALRNPLALQVFSTEELTALIHLFRVVGDFEKDLSDPDNVSNTGRADAKFKCVKGTDISPFNKSLPERYILLEKAGPREIVRDSGDFDEGYLDRVLNLYQFTPEGRKKISADIFEIVRLVNRWLDLSGNEFIFDPRMFRMVKRSS